MRTRNAAGAPRRPLPLCAGGRERGRLGLVTHLPPVPEGGRACLVPSRRRGGRGLSPPRTGDHPPTLDISQEFRVCVCVCVCVSARMAVLLSAKCFLRGCTEGRWGSPCSFAEPCVCVTVQSAPGLSSPLACCHPRAFADLQDICYQPSLKIWPAFPTGRPKRSRNSHPTPGENKKLSIERSCLSLPGSCPAPPTRGRGRW